MPAETVRTQRVEHTPPARLAHRFALLAPQGIAKTRRAFREVTVVRPAQVQDGPIEMILQHPLDRPGTRPHVARESKVQVQVIFPLDVDRKSTRRTPVTSG